MKRYTISRGKLGVDNIEIFAKNEERALELAESAPDSEWESCENPEGYNYQIESEERAERGAKESCFCDDLPLPDSVSFSWHFSDVQEIRPDLTADQSREVLRLVMKQHDANHGVTWETLEAASVALFGNAPESEAES